MTDNRTAELLCKLLDERGMKWRKSEGYGTGCIFVWWDSPTFGEVHATANDDGTLFMACLNNCDFTPEQAIAATLGSEREKALEELVRDMWFWGYEGHMDNKSQDWQMKHIDGVLDRMKKLGIEVD